MAAACGGRRAELLLAQVRVDGEDSRAPSPGRDTRRGLTAAACGGKKAELLLAQARVDGEDFRARVR